MWNKNLGMPKKALGIPFQWFCLCICRSMDVDPCRVKGLGFPSLQRLRMAHNILQSHKTSRGFSLRPGFALMALETHSFCSTQTGLPVIHGGYSFCTSPRADVSESSNPIERLFCLLGGRGQAFPFTKEVQG